MSKKIYMHLLKGNFKELAHFADETLESKSNPELFRIIATSIVPLIRRSPAFERFYFQCIKKREKYDKKINECEINAPKEIEAAFSTLKSDIEKAQLNDADITKCISDIDHVLNNKESCAIPPYLEVAYEGIVYLLGALLKKDNPNIVKSYAILNTSLRYSKDNEKIISEFNIQETTFAPSLFRLKELQEIFSWNNVKDTWVAWEFFVLLEWCWNTPFSFFEDKKQNYIDYQSANYSNHLLFLNDSWCLINKLKNNAPVDLTLSVFQRRYFIEYMKQLGRKQPSFK